MKKTFSLRTVLTVVTDRLLTESNDPSSNGIDKLYEILDHMTGDNLFTHQLPRAGHECKPWLLRWFPELTPAMGGLNKLDEWLKLSPTCPQEGIKMWVAELKMMFPEIKDSYEVGQIPKDDHEHIHSIDELIQMRGSDEGIVVVKPE